MKFDSTFTISLFCLNFAFGTRIDLESILDPGCVIYGQQGFLPRLSGTFQYVNMALDQLDPELTIKSRCIMFIVQNNDLAPYAIENLGKLGVAKKVLLTNSVNPSSVNIHNYRFNFDILSVSFDGNVTHSLKVNWIKNRHVESIEGSVKAITDDEKLSSLLSQKPLKLGVADMGPFNIIQGDGSFSGFDVDMWRIAAETVGVPVNFEIVPLLEHTEQISGGYLDANCVPLGIAGTSAGVKVSLSLNQRENFLIGKPPGLVKREEAFIDPFNRWVWVGLVFSLTGMWVTLCFVEQYSPLLKLDAFETFTISLGIMINESIPEKMLILNKSHSKTLLLGFWLLMATLLSMAYTSNLLASLVKERHEKPVDTFQDILDEDITVFLNGKSPARVDFANSPVDIIQEVHEKQVLAKEGAVYVMSDSEVFPFAIETIASGKGVFDNIEIRQHGVKHIFRRGKHLTFASIPTFYHIAMNHPVIEKFNGVFLLMLDNGIYRGYLQNKYIFMMEFSEREFYRKEPLESSWHKLSLDHLQSTFYVLLFMVMAVFSFYMEARKSIIRREITRTRNSLMAIILKSGNIIGGKTYSSDKQLH